MAYIYKITNQKNGKSYIGKTIYTIEKRWREHCADAFREKNKNRPLYRAMQKYGIESFSIEEIEECSIDIVNEREKFWIEMYGTYSSGYNATLGGDGRTYVDYELIVTLWNKGYISKEIHNITNYDIATIKAALDNEGILNSERIQRAKEKKSKKVIMLDKNTKQPLQIFNSITDAYKYLNKQYSGHIAQVCTGKRKSAYGYCWEYLIY